MLIKYLECLFNILIIMLVLIGCQSQTYTAPVRDLHFPVKKTKNTHIVAKGETLYSIAWRYDLDYKKLAMSNQLDKDFRIYPGQKLTLKLDKHKHLPPLNKAAQKNLSSVELAKPQPNRKRPTPIKKPSIGIKSVSDQRVNVAKNTQKSLINKTLPVKVARQASRKNSPVKWRWPMTGPVISTFSANGGLNKGIDIRGKLGDSVSAAAGGDVVYAGSGLRGYGKLLIVKHTDKFLSAYAHNSKLLVNEGQPVKSGQKIAELGSSGTNGVKLHFEIRLNGSPVDPIKYLPR